MNYFFLAAATVAAPVAAPPTAAIPNTAHPAGPHASNDPTPIDSIPTPLPLAIPHTLCSNISYTPQKIPLFIN